MQELTSSATHPLGGNASLSLENAEEPYLGGVRFTAMPPTKRFRDMDLLSGGEKVNDFPLLLGFCDGIGICPS